VETIIEPRASTQWFVKNEAPGRACDCGRWNEATSKFYRTIAALEYFEWMRNIRDWCISRQLWWGHRIPAWYCSGCKEIIVGARDAVEMHEVRRGLT